MNITSRLLLSAGLIAGAATVAQAKIERVVEKSFNVQPGGTLHVSTQGGEVRVSASNDNVVKVTAREKFRVNTDAEADEILKKLELSIEQSGNEVTATSKYEKQPLNFHFGSWPPVNVDFIVTVPASFLTDLHTSGGNIVIGDLGGKVYARTSGGNIRLGKIGAEVDAHTSGGDVQLDGAKGPVKLGTSGGSIVAGAVAGEADLDTSGGNIQIDSVEGSLRARTSGGNVRAGLVGPLKQDCSLSTSGGNVKVTVDKTAAFRLDASTSGGSVQADGLTITLDGAKHGRSSLNGSVNGGTAMLKLRSSGGNIVVATR